MQEESDILKIVRMVAARNYDPCIVFNFSKKEVEALAQQASLLRGFVLGWEAPAMQPRNVFNFSKKKEVDALAQHANPGYACAWHCRLEQRCTCLHLHQGWPCMRATERSWCTCHACSTP